MKLLEQISLWCHDGKADKVYEIDLCEIGNGKYVVNFRYGRRGAALKDGTKTALAVSLDEARKIQTTLIAEKKKGGYQETERFLASAESAEAITTLATSHQVGESKSDFILARLREAVNPNVKKEGLRWSLSRLIWRVGELRLREAVPILLPLLAKGDAIQHYSVCWALGRCGDTSVIPVLEQVRNAAATAPMTKRIALIALLALERNEEKRNVLVSNVLEKMSKVLEAEVTSGTSESLANYLSQNLGKGLPYEALVQLYLLADDIEYVHDALVKTLHLIPLAPDGFKTFRYIFKIAEFRDDAPIFAVLAKRLENSTHFFKAPRYGDSVWVNHQRYDIKDETKKSNSKLAFSDKTQEYFLRRAWRTMRTLGNDSADAYVHFAASFLLNYSDADFTAPSTRRRTRYTYNSQTRRYDYSERSTHYDSFAKYLIFNHILYENSPRYELKKTTKAWRCKNDYQPGQPAPQEREEAFLTLWDKHPQVLLNLILKSNNERVQDFAVKAFSSQENFAQYIDIETLMQILAKPYQSTTRLGLDIAKQIYEPKQPDLTLLTLLAQHPLREARDVAKEWIEAQSSYFLSETFIFAKLIVNPYADVWDWTRLSLAANVLDENESKMLISKCLIELLDLKLENPKAEISAEGACQTLSGFYIHALSAMDLVIVEDLLASSIANVQTLGAVILLHHKIAVTELPSRLIARMIQSPTMQVRQAGVKLFGRLPQETLLQNYDVIAAFCVSPHSEIRQAIQPTIRGLATESDAFAQKLGTELLPYMQRNETYEGLHKDLLKTFEDALQNFLSTIGKDMALSLVHGGRMIPQQLGLTILNHYVNHAELSIRQIIRFANHEMLDLRHFAQTIFSRSIERMKAESEDALRILDAKWDDSRAFAFEYFRANFDENDWTPALLISVCDSTRPDVQSFGRELITKYFKEENGEQFLLQLSQHPSQTVQHFTTHYLEQFATSNQANIEKLEPYFVTVLSQVNKAGVAKHRIFNFLKSEAMKNEQVATLVARVMARQSVTLAVADKAACIQIMRDLKVVFPNMELPLKMAA